MSEAVRTISTTMPASRQSSDLAGLDRGKVANAIERLIALLDALDGDCDLEDGHVDEENGDERDDDQSADLEPMLGWTTSGQHGNSTKAGDEVELTDEDGSETGDADNGVGDLDGMIEQWPILWGGHGHVILDDGEPDDFETGERVTFCTRQSPAKAPRHPQMTTRPTTKPVKLTDRYGNPIIWR